MYKFVFSLLMFLFGVTAPAQPPGFTRYDLNPNVTSFPNNFMIYKDVLYFEAYVDGYGMEICKFDDVSAPSIAKDLYPGSGWGNFHPITAYNDIIYFWGTNGYTDGIYAYDLSKDTITLLIGDSLAINNYAFAAYSDKFYFYDNNHITGINSVYEYDIGNQTLDTIFNLPYYSYIDNIQGIGNTIYISALSSTHTTKYGLYAYDADTKQTDTLLTHYYGPVVEAFAELNGKVYFAATDPVCAYELFEYDGLSPPKRVTDYNPGPASTVYTTFPVIVSYNHKICFAGFDSLKNKALYEYDPGSGNTKLVYTHQGYNNNMQHGFATWAAHEYHERLFLFGADPQRGLGLFVYNGYSQPYMIAELCDNYFSSRIYFIEYHDDLFFAAVDSNEITSLYRYNDSSLTIEQVIPESKVAVTVYPNPTSQTAQLLLQFEHPETVSVRLTDINGRVCYQQEYELFSPGNHSIVLPVQKLAAGIYIYTIFNRSGGVLHSGRLLKQ